MAKKVGEKNDQKVTKKSAENGLTIVGIDPGISGAIITLNSGKINFLSMPIKTTGKDKMISFDGVLEILDKIQSPPGRVHAFLERAVPMAMGSKHAFNYGRGFAALEIALELTGMPVTYVEPNKWAKEMHEGVSSDLKPKVKSLIAAERLFPSLVKQLPRGRTGKIHDGAIDALLIAAYGQRKLGQYIPEKDTDDFY